MATAGRRADPGLSERLFTDGHAFEFFQAVRLLGRIRNDKPPVGGESHPADEAVRFVVHHSLAYPASPIYKVQGHGPNAPAEMAITFFALAGREGVLPLHYAEHIVARGYEHDHAAGAFLDLFVHRLASFLYRAWEKHDFPVQYERESAAGLPAERGLTRYVFDLIGLGTIGLRARFESIDPRALVFYGGLIAQRPHSAIAFESILRDYFSVPMRVEQFRGKWFRISGWQLSRLGLESGHSRLSESAVAGDSVWSQQASVRIHVGPLTFKQFCSFLPGRSAFSEVTELARFYLDRSLDFDVSLTLLAAEVPYCRLAGGSALSTELGLSTWLKTAEFQKDPEGIILGSAGLRASACGEHGGRA